LVDALRQLTHGYGGEIDDTLEQALADHKMLVERPRDGRVLIIGGGLVASEAALCLAGAGVPVQISAPEPSPVSLDPMGFHTSAAAAIRAYVGERYPAAQIEMAPHWTAVSPGLCGVVIVATATVQPDRAITDHLSRHYLPHLVVRAHHDLATVGPLVDHNGPCLGCLDLTVADHDAHWPATLAALISRPSLPTALAGHWAGTQAALEATWFLRGLGTTLNASTIEVDAAHAGVARRRWHPHSDCACACPSVTSLSAVA